MWEIETESTALGSRVNEWIEAQGPVARAREAFEVGQTKIRSLDELGQHINDEKGQAKALTDATAADNLARAQTATQKASRAASASLCACLEAAAMSLSWPTTLSSTSAVARVGSSAPSAIISTTFLCYRTRLSQGATLGVLHGPGDRDLNSSPLAVDRGSPLSLRVGGGVSSLPVMSVTLLLAR